MMSHLAPSYKSSYITFFKNFHPNHSFPSYCLLLSLIEILARCSMEEKERLLSLFTSIVYDHLLPHAGTHDELKTRRYFVLRECFLQFSDELAHSSCVILESTIELVSMYFLRFFEPPPEFLIIYFVPPHRQLRRVT